MDMMVDLPTPGPAKMPRRCPRPQVSRASTARMPVPMGLLMGTRCMQSTARTLTGRCPPPAILTGPLPSMGRPRASMTRPRSMGLQMMRCAPEVMRHGIAGGNALQPAEGHHQRRTAAEADDLSGDGTGVARDDDARIDGCGKIGHADGRVRARIRPGRGSRPMGWPGPARFVTAAASCAAILIFLVKEFGGDTVQLGFDAGVDLAGAEAGDAAAGGDGVVGRRVRPLRWSAVWPGGPAGIFRGRRISDGITSRVTRRAAPAVRRAPPRGWRRPGGCAGPPGG